MSIANDDLGNAKKPFKVVACLPVFGRLPLLEQTIKRLYLKNDCYKVICSGDGQERELCESLGAVWVPHQNKPLGAKWNAAFKKAQDYYPDAVLYVGSSDWLSDDWNKKMQPYVENHDFVGTAGCYFMDIAEEVRVCHWRGYKFTKFHQDRADETIGIGRMISANLMEKLKWEPFHNTYDNSLDRSMKDRCKALGVDDFMVSDASLLPVSISTNKWVNKHNFRHHWDGALQSERIEDVEKFISNFPETKSVFNENRTMLRQQVGE